MNLPPRYAFLKNPSFILLTYIIVVVVASIHRYLLGIDHINNYLIFKYSFSNLLANKDLFVPHTEYNDLYKYSPTFAFLMAPFSALPIWFGLIVWNLLNVLVLFLAIKKFPVGEENLPSYHIPVLGQARKTIVYWFVLLELLTSVQNSQSNGLMAGLMLMTFVSFERKNVFWAAFFIALSFYIKVFGIMGAILFLMYPDKIKFILYMSLWMVVLFFIPLLVVPFKQLIFLYQSWINLLVHDQSHSLNFSVMTFFRCWFNVNLQDIYFQITGLLLLLIPFTKYKSYQLPEFKILILSSILIWVIIFNHKAESPTFVIAMTGVALWFISEKNSGLSISLLVVSFILTSLSSTDIFPKYVRHEIIVPYVLKVFPCILIWIRIQWLLLVSVNNPLPIPCSAEAHTTGLGGVHTETVNTQP